MTEFEETIKAIGLMRKPVLARLLPPPRESWRMHELAHAISGDADHGEEFERALRFLDAVKIANAA